MNPYKCLGVTIDADDATIKQAYLQAVRNNPPEKAEKFQAIRTAYEAIKTNRDRVGYALFHPPQVGIEEILMLYPKDQSLRSPSLEVINAFLGDSL